MLLKKLAILLKNIHKNSSPVKNIKIKAYQ